MTKFNAPEKLRFKEDDLHTVIHSTNYKTDSDFAVEYTRSDLLKKYFKEISDAADKLHSLLNRSRDLYPKTSDAVVCMFKPLNTIDEILKKVNDDE